MAIDYRDRARTQALCWLLDELFDAEGVLLAALDRGAIGGWRRERLGEFCERVGEGCEGSERWSVRCGSGFCSTASILPFSKC
jgi:hypothetical protein